MTQTKAGATAKGRPLRPFQYAYLLGAMLLWGPGAWFVVTRRASFHIGGDNDAAPWQSNRFIPVDTAGGGAVAIGVGIIALGVIHVSQGFNDRRRIPVFFLGAAMLLGAIGYGVVHAFWSA